MRLARALNRQAEFLIPEGLPLTVDNVSSHNAVHFQTSNDSTLSVFELRDGGPDFERVALALATRRKGYSDMDIAIASAAAILDAGATVDRTAGDTALEDVNAEHHSIGNVTLHVLGKLVCVFLAQNERVTVNKWDIAARLERLLEEGVDLPAETKRTLADEAHKLAFRNARALAGCSLSLTVTQSSLLAATCLSRWSVDGFRFRLGRPVLA